MRHLTYPPGPEEVEKVLAGHADARGVVVVTPTDYGTFTDLAGIREVCHRHDRVFIVDEAWGAHLPFHPALPHWPLPEAADPKLTTIRVHAG